MFLIKTELRKSIIPNAGNGVFTLEDIKKGQVIWNFQVGVDFVIPTDELKLYPLHVQEYHKKFSYRAMLYGIDSYIFCGDNAKHMNHSDNPNTNDSGTTICVANCDIKIGEELTCNYTEFDLDSKIKLEF